MAKIDRAAKVQLLADFDAQYAAFVTAGMDEAGRLRPLLRGGSG